MSLENTAKEEKNLNLLTTNLKLCSFRIKIIENTLFYSLNKGLLTWVTKVTSALYSKHLVGRGLEHNQAPSCPSPQKGQPSHSLLLFSFESVV